MPQPNRSHVVFEPHKQPVLSWFRHQMETIDGCTSAQREFLEIQPVQILKIHTFSSVWTHIHMLLTSLDLLTFWVDLINLFFFLQKKNYKAGIVCESSTSNRFLIFSTKNVCCTAWNSCVSCGEVNSVKILKNTGKKCCLKDKKSFLHVCRHCSKPWHFPTKLQHKKQKRCQHLLLAPSCLFLFCLTQNSSTSSTFHISTACEPTNVFNFREGEQKRATRKMRKRFGLYRIFNMVYIYVRSLK